MLRPLVAALVVFAIAVSAAPALATTPPAPPSTKTVSPTTPAPPRPEGTPWPAPTGLKVVVLATLVNPDGSFIPPERRQYRATASWNVASGFAGRYEVEFARRARTDGGPLLFLGRGALDASVAKDGRVTVEEVVSFRDSLDAQFCFRLRSVTTSAANPNETGPYAMACSVLPPSSGGAPVVPLPPVVGGGTASASGGWLDWWAIVAAGAAAVLGAAGLAVTRSTRHKIRTT